MMRLLEHLIRLKNGISYITTSYYGTEIVSGEEEITTGTPIVIGTTDFKSITLLADKENEQNINIGDFPLFPGAAQSFEFSDVSSISLTTTGTNQKLYWVGVK